MSKARDLGNLLDTDGDVNSNSLDNVPTPFFALQHKFQDASFGHFVELTGVANEPTGTRLCGIVISPDGTKLYTPQADRNSPLPDYMRIVQFTLGTPFDLSTITNTVTPANSLDVSGQVNALGAGGPFTNSDDSIGGIHFKSDGTKLWMMTGHSISHNGADLHSGNKLVEYDLSTAWDITSATFNNKWSEALYGYSASQFKISEDGRFLYHGQTDKLKQWEMTTPFDISTLTQYESYNSEQTYLKFYQCTREHSSSGAPGTVDHIADMWMSKDGLRWFGLFTHGLSHDAIIYGYTMTTKYDITTSVPIGLVSEHLSRQDPPWQNSLMIGGTNHPNGNVGQQTGMSDEWSSYVQSMFFADDGKKLYVAGYYGRYPNRGVGGIQQYNITDSYKLSIADQGIKIEGEIELASGASVNEISTDTGMSSNSNTAIPTERAVKTYVDTEVGNVPTPTKTSIEALSIELPATNLTGTIANARISESAVTQHVTGYDDSTIKSDILKLALSQAVDGNRVAYNLSNSFIDGFEDDTGITTETTVDRNTTNEYVSTLISSPVDYSSTLSPTYATFGNFAHNFNANTAHAKLTDADGNDGFGTAGSSLGGGFTIDYGASKTFASGQLDIGSYRTNGDLTGYKVEYSTDNSTYTAWDMSGRSGAVVNLSGSSSLFTSGTSAGVINLSGHSSNGHWSIIRITTVPTITARYIKVTCTAGNFHDPNGWINTFDLGTVQGESFSATGTLISDPQTASSARTSCSGVIVYEDSEGTNTLGTDLKIYFTANNGTNWTEASSYGTAVTFSGSKKLVTLGNTTVTSGTQIALKAVWANQADGSKEARLHGWAVNY